MPITTRRRLVPLQKSDETPEERRTLQGSAEEIALDLHSLEAVGVTHAIVEFGATDESELLETIDWMGREVLPLMSRGT